MASWGNWRTAFTDQVEEVGGSTRHPERGPAHQPGHGQDGFTSERPPPRDRPRPEPQERPSSWDPVDVPDPDGMRRSPGTETRTDMSPRSWRERQ